MIIKSDLVSPFDSSLVVEPAKRNTQFISTWTDGRGMNEPGIGLQKDRERYDINIIIQKPIYNIHIFPSFNMSSHPPIFVIIIISFLCPISFKSCMLCHTRRRMTKNRSYFARNLFSFLYPSRRDLWTEGHY